MEPWTDVRQLFGQLVDELERVRKRGLNRVDGFARLPPLGEGKYTPEDKLQIPLIASLAGEWAVNQGHDDLARCEQIDLLIRAATARITLKGANGRLQPHELGEAQ